MCLPTTITLLGLIGDPSNGNACSTAVNGVHLAVLTTSSCDIMCDQSAGYEEKKGKYTCGSVGNLAAGQAASLTITSCETVPCPANSQRVTASSCTCQSGFVGGVVYNGTAYVGTCHKPGLKVVGRVGGGITSEQGLQDTVTVELESQPVFAVTVTATTDTPTEGTVSPLMLTFSPTNWNVPQTLTVTGVDDLIQDSVVPYKVVVTSASGDADYDSLTAYWDIFNNDDDAAVIVKDLPFVGMPQTTSEDGTSGWISFYTRTRPLSNVLISCTTSNPVESMLQPDSVTIIPTMWNVDHIIKVIGLDDDIIDGGVSYSVSCVATSNDVFYNGLTIQDSTFLNADNDSAAITFSTNNLVLYEDPSSSSNTVNVSVWITSKPTAAVTLQITSADNTEALLSTFPIAGYTPTISITINPADWNVPVTFSVQSLDDFQIDGDQLFVLNTVVMTTDADYSMLTVGDIFVKVVDWNSAGVVFCNNFTTPTACDDPTTALVIGETQEQNNMTDVIKVKLTSEPTASVTLRWASSDTTEGSLVQETLTFSTTNWGTFQTLTIEGQDDLIDDGDIWYWIDFSSLTTTDPNYSVFGNTLKPTSGLSTVALQSEPSRFLRATLINIDNDFDECLQSNLNCSFDCFDPNFNNLNDWTCNCTWPYQGDNMTATDSTCYFDECLLNSEICLLATQTCIDVDTTYNSTGDWECECVSPSTGFNGVAQAANCVFDECILHRRVCESNDPGQQQTCRDSNPDYLSVDDWYCDCNAPTNGSNLTSKATCTRNECDALPNLCTPPGYCIDPNIDPLVVNDYYCYCPDPFTSNQTTDAGRLSHRGECYLDECTFLNNNNTCVNGNRWQMCIDPNIGVNSTDDWECRCVDPAVGTATVAATAICYFDECLRNASVTCDPGVWWHSGTGNGYGHAYNQTCYDINVDANSLHDWYCSCDFPAFGSANLEPAICTVDECTLGTFSCTGGTICVDPNTNTHDITSVDDWYCLCPYPQTFNETVHNITGNYTTSPSTHRPPSCILDECLVNGVLCASAGQTCLDLNMSVDSVNDWGCVCVTETTSNFSNMSTSDCFLDECLLNTTQCGPSQTCNDTNTLEGSIRDWVCICPQGQNGTNIAGPASCTIDECDAFDCGLNQTCTDRNTSVDSRHDYYCTCDSPWIGEMRAWMADCIFDECSVNRPTCELANQDCVDSSDSLDDWRCVCRDPWTGPDGDQQEAACQYDECLAITHCNDFGQDCFDTDFFTPNTWVCRCRLPLTGNDGNGVPAFCTINECDDPATSLVCTAVNQFCTDPDITSENNWQCNCVAPLAGVSTASVALCSVDLCVGNALATCAQFGQTCVQRGMQWYCDCESPSTGQPALQGPANCTVDSCAAMGGAAVCSQYGQICKDDGTGWKCHCREPFTGVPIQGKSTCFLDECTIKERCPLPFQTCFDPNTATTSDWVCRCDSPSVGNDSTISDALCILDECAPKSPKTEECINLGQTCLDSDPTTKSLNNSKCVLCTETSVECNTNIKTECDNDAIRSICEREGNQRCVDRNNTRPNDWECVCNDPFVGRALTQKAHCVDPVSAKVDTAADVRSSTDTDSEGFPFILLLLALLVPILCALAFLVWKNKTKKSKKKHEKEKDNHRNNNSSDDDSDDNSFKFPKEENAASPGNFTQQPTSDHYDEFTFSKHPAKGDLFSSSHDKEDFDFDYGRFQSAGASPTTLYRRPLGRGVDVTMV
eukprot:TRINITY_DN3038_c0_g2_i1.p1 TRINITY_DN3038_c0_g2~~TRINITY_DN3038_c0_g2_i1.p1  ORF type:complete len:1959 (+),score=363.60 TRINITY_DN3038_c0_g2_i1:727-5877(+)